MAEPVDDEQMVYLPSTEELFQRLPPLNSSEYVEYVRTAPRAELPPEVLVRAYRQLPPNSPGAQATLKRLCHRTADRWEYLEPLAREARRQAPKQQDRNRADEHHDLFQDAVRHILGVLRTERGTLAERTWHTFCRIEFWNAWRKSYGRRGERLGLVRAEPRNRSEKGDEEVDPATKLEDSFWEKLAQQTQREQIEAIALAVVDAIEDSFIRDVARATWFSSQRPKTSGDTKPDLDPPLLDQFPGKNRDQVNRALRKADSQLAAALLAEAGMTWPDDLRKILEKQSSRGK